VLPELLKAYPGFDDGDMIRAIAWSPHGSLLAAGSGTHLLVWDLSTGVRSEFPMSHNIYALGWSPDGQLLVACDKGTTSAVTVWNIGEGTRHTLEDPDGDPRAAFSVAWSPATQALALSRGSGTIEVWDTQAWRCVSRPQRSPLRVTYEVAWAPDGILLASAEEDSQIRLWDTRTGKLHRTLEGHSGHVSTVAWSTDGQLLASGGDDQTILLWNLGDATQQKRLEGHLGAINCVRLSHDGRLLASQSDDETVRIWDTEAGLPLATIDVPSPSTPDRSLTNEIDFHPSEPKLATLDPTGTGIRIWRLDVQDLTRARAEAVRYTTARIVLVGDSGVGKTGLGWRLARGEFKEHPSTHGQQFWTLDQLEATRVDGTHCEAILWDLAGQPDYRLVHSLFLDTVDVALLLFDPTNRQDSLAGVDYWFEHLQAGKSEPLPVILVGARIDRGSATLTAAELTAYCVQRGIAGGYIPTSAKDGDGLPELTDQVKALVPWETMPATITTETFKRIRDYVLSLKEDTAQHMLLVSMPTLRQRLEATDPTWRFSDAEATTAVRHLETHGYVALLRSTDGNEFVLLAPELLSKLASSIVLEARRETHGLGALDETRLLEGDYRLPELDDLDHGQRRILLDAVTLLFLKHNICFREYLGNNVLLVFPALINERRPLIGDTQTVDDVSYALAGAVENVYAALAVLLGYTNTFTRTHQWQNQAQYELGSGEICGFRQIDQGKGAVQLILYYGTATPDRVKLLFQGLFETFLMRKGLRIVRYRPVICPDCGEHQDRAVVMKQVERERAFLFCANCGSRTSTPKPDDLTVTVTGNEEMHQQRLVADQRTAFETGLVSIKSLLLERDDDAARPTCFISYAWGAPEHERWVLQLAKDLRNADIDVILDRWHSPPGSDLGRYIDRVLSCQFVIVVGTPELRRKYEADSGDPVVAAELELVSLRLRQPKHYGRTVLPILLEGHADEAFTPMLQKLVNIDFRQEKVYFPRLLAMIWQLYSLPADHPILEELQVFIADARH
jgi:small GTP-binding protein